MGSSDKPKICKSNVLHSAEDGAAVFKTEAPLFCAEGDYPDSFIISCHPEAQEGGGSGCSIIKAEDLPFGYEPMPLTLKKEYVEQSPFFAENIKPQFGED